MSALVMIVAGGTGGHVYPGLAVADALRNAGFDLCWMGTRHGIEARLVPGAGLSFDTIPIAGLRRSGLLRWLLAPLRIVLAVICATTIMLRRRPRVVLGLGGFVSGPGGIAAWLCRRPLIIHEQNAVAGLTNRILSRFAARVCEGFAHTFPPAVGALTTGNPVRAEIAALGARAPRAPTLDDEHLSLLVFGGSRGARALNRALPAALSDPRLRGRVRVLHQCGDAELTATRAGYAAALEDDAADVRTYIDDMAGAYRDADLVVARAGALTLAEIAACGVASILVPYPYAVDDHQTQNASALVAAGAAVLIPETELEPKQLADHIADLIENPARLADMAAAARALGRPDATEALAQQCREFARG